MKKIVSALILISSLLTVSSLRADEGMWLPMLIERLNQRDLQLMGLQLSPEEIYSVNHSSLKDAVVSMGGFCTGEIVSPNGLMFTNHHCGYDAIRENSTVENDYLTKGFWASSYAEEKPNEGLYVSFLVRMEDVTARVLEAVEGIAEESQRRAKIAEVSRVIAAEAEEGNGYDAEVESFFAGNEFYLFVYETYRDVRLVGAPPSSIGKFGGDTDNWEWPRHTGDFSVFRIYTAPDGSPAEYSPENIPMKSKYYFPVSLAGVKEGDFTMTMGYPGSTERYLTSYGVQQALQKKNPTIVSIRDKKLEVLRADMKASDAVRLKYASKYAQIANYWKYFIGQSEQLKALDVRAEKEALEKRFQEWATSTPALKDKYGNALQMIKEGTAMKDSTVVGGTYVVEAGLLGADAVLFSYRLGQRLEAYLAMEEGPEKEAMKDELKVQAAQFFEEVNIPTDQALLAVTSKMYYENVSPAQQPAYLLAAGKKYADKWMKYAEKIYDKSLFTDKESLNEFIESPEMEELEEDPLYQISTQLFGIYRNQAVLNGPANELIAKGNRLFQAGLQEMMPDRAFYPDANSTMRVSFGNVEMYQPRDGVIYNYYTTLEGLMAKEDPEDEEFIVPAKLKELYIKKDYGRYADASGEMRVNFLSTNDITGGNSGSPVLNGNGELVGIAFDGNWEAMSGDINFEPSVQRTISVDIRYVLFVIEKLGGAEHLIAELKLVSAQPKDRAQNTEKTLPKTKLTAQ